MAGICNASKNDDGQYSIRATAAVVALACLAGLDIEFYVVV